MNPEKVQSAEVEGSSAMHTFKYKVPVVVWRASPKYEFINQYVRSLYSPVRADLVLQCGASATTCWRVANYTASAYRRGRRFATTTYRQLIKRNILHEAAALLAFVYIVTGSWGFVRMSLGVYLLVRCVPPRKPPAAPAAGGLFGKPPAAPAAGGLFGKPPAAPAGGMFGKRPAAPAAGGLFG